jgi:hypothetical protein
MMLVAPGGGSAELQDCAQAAGNFPRAALLAVLPLGWWHHWDNHCQILFKQALGKQSHSSACRGVTHGTGDRQGTVRLGVCGTVGPINGIGCCA